MTKEGRLDPGRAVQCRQAVRDVNLGHRLKCLAAEMDDVVSNDQTLHWQPWQLVGRGS